MAWDHPVPLGRWAALQDEAFWVPMAGIVSRVADRFGLGAEAAGTLIASGMAQGEIGHRAVPGDDWVVAPRGAELVRLSGFNYDTMLDWRNGCMVRPGADPLPVLVFWPDVERAVQSKGGADQMIDHEPMLALPAPGRGRPAQSRLAILAEMKKAIEFGVTSLVALQALKQDALAEMFRTSRKTAVAALQELVGPVPK